MINQLDQATCKAIIRAWWRGERVGPADIVEIEMDGVKQEVVVEQRHWRVADRAHILFAAGYDLDLVAFDIPQAGEPPRTYYSRDLLP